MKLTKSKLKQIIREELSKALNEIETEEETVNKSVDPGDWILRATTRAGEEYVVKQAKFPKLYYPEPVGEGPEGFQAYEVRPDDRTGIVITPELVERLQQEFPREEGDIPQADIHAWMSNEKTITVRKQSQVYAKQAQGSETVITRVEKCGEECIGIFEAPWGGTMPIKLNDVLIINDKEVYRIARAEFDQTYQPI